MEKLIKYGGMALILGGISFTITNVAISPFVDFEVPFSEMLTSSPFFYRMIFAALTVAFLLFGSIGLYLYHSQIERAKMFMQVTFIIAFFGSAFLLANEWHQIFVLPEIAKISPEAIDKLGSSDNIGRDVIGAMIAFAMFSIGWILFTISVLIARKLNRLGPVLVIA
ncbi:MAG: hypothetical protein HKO81_09600, partial [Flavobacteriaceae bacterium]|nr:hypothetical protein [Flavobacteriaceae bacterium]